MALLPQHVPDTLVEPSGARLLIDPASPGVPRFGFNREEWPRIVAEQWQYVRGYRTEWPEEYRTPTEKFYRWLYQTGRIKRG